MLVVASGADHARVISTINPMPLTAQRTTIPLTDGRVDPTWTHVYPFHLLQRPATLDVVVMHTGTLRYRNGSWPYRNTKYTAVMDAFKLSMTGTRPVPGGALSGYTLTGGEVGTTLQMNMGYECLPMGDNSARSWAGDYCDLRCNYTQTSNFVQCQSVNGTRQICQSGGRNYVSEKCLRPRGEACSAPL